MADKISKINLNNTEYNIEDASVHTGTANKVWKTNANGVAGWYDAPSTGGTGIESVTFETVGGAPLITPAMLNEMMDKEY